MTTLLQRATLISIVLMFGVVGLARGQVDYRRLFTLNPGEGRHFLVDTTAVVGGGAGVPGLHVTRDGRIILGYGKPGTPGRGTAELLDNGKRVSFVNGVISPGNVDGGFVYLPDGRLRFITEEPAPGNTQQRHLSRIISWISSDGLNWNRENGIRYQPGIQDDSISSVASVLQVNDSIWRMYYVGDFYRTNGIRTAISSDWGWTWLAESEGNILRKGDVDPHPVFLSDGRVRLYHRTGFGASPGTDPALIGVAFTDSDDGLHFDTSLTTVVVPDSSVDGMLKLDPAVIRFPNGDVACYIGATTFQGGATSKVIVAWDRRQSSIGSEPRGGPAEDFRPGPFNVGPDGIRIGVAVDIATRLTLSVYGTNGTLAGRAEVSAAPGDNVVTLGMNACRTGVYWCVLSSMRRTTVRMFMWSPRGGR